MKSVRFAVWYVVSFLVGFAIAAGIAALVGVGPNQLFTWWFCCSVSGAMGTAIFTAFHNVFFREPVADSEQERRP